MSPADLLNLFVAIVALVIATVSLVRTRKVQALQLEMQAKQARLAEAQHKALTRQQEAARRADLRFELVRDGKIPYFLVSNQGAAVATQVSFGFFGKGPVIASQFNQVFPIAELLPGASVRLAAVLTLSMPSAIEGEFTWTNLDGQIETRRCKIVL